LDTSEGSEDLQAEVDALSEELSAMQEMLKDCQDRLAAFEAEYRRVIAHRLARVEQLQAELAAARGRRDAEAEARAVEAARVAQQLTPEERWKSMLKRIMPRALDDEDYDERERLAKLVNEAWERRDMDRLDELEAEIDRLTVKDADPAERQAILGRARLRFLNAVARARKTLSELQSTALWALLVRAEEARSEGRDLLREQADELDAVAATLEEEIASIRADIS